MIYKIYIDGNKIDLFKDESVELNSSISDIGDIQKSTTDYSKDFTVPASANNNKYFKHYYNADIDNSFDARVKVNGKIELGGLPFKFGKFRLLKVQIKKGEAYSYTINFVGNLTDIKKEIGKDELSALPLSQYDHEFNGVNVRQGLVSGLSFGGLEIQMYYTLNPKRQYFYNSDINDVTNTDKLTNIAFNGATGEHGVRFTDLSPSLRVIRILEAIETKYNLTFSRDFFGTSEFTELFQTITNTKESVSGGSQIVDFDGGSSEFMSLVSNTGTYYVRATSASNDNIKFKLYLNVTPSAGYENVNYTSTIIIDGNDNDSETGTGNSTLYKLLSVNGEQTFSVQYKITSSEEFKYTASLNQVRSSTVPNDGGLTITTTTASENTLLSNFIIANNMPKIKVIDWLVGLFKAFKLVIIPQEDGSFYVDTLNRYYAKGTIYDITEYIDFESNDVERGELFNEILFNFKEPETIIAQQFLKQNGLAYGDEEVILNDEDGNPLDGDSYEIEVPFETVVYDRLRDFSTDTLTGIMYAPFVDSDVEPTFPKINFSYIKPALISSSPIKFIGSNGVSEQIGGFIKTSFHGDLYINSNYSFLFGSEVNEWNGSLYENNLYTNHHKKYIDSIFNVKRRNFKYKAVLPLWLQTKIQLNDVVRIKDNYYRIDNYTTNLNTGRTNLKLFNALETTLTDLTSGNNTVYSSASGGTYSVLSNSNNTAANVVDTGDGDDWLTASMVGNNLEIVTDENTSGEVRTAFVSLVDIDKKRANEDIYIIQSE